MITAWGLFSRFGSFATQTSSLSNCRSPSRIGLGHSCSRCSRHAPRCQLSSGVGTRLSLGFRHWKCSRSKPHCLVWLAKSSLTRSFQRPERWNLQAFCQLSPIWRRWHFQEVLQAHSFQGSYNTNRMYGSSAEQRCWRSWCPCSWIRSHVPEDDLIQRFMLPFSTLA